MTVRNSTTAILWHCTATPEGREVTYDDLWQWHVVENGWNHIGYHYLVQLDGTVVECRPEDQVGAHCKDGGMNNVSVAITYAGGIMNDGSQRAKDTRTAAQITAMYSLTGQLLNKYGLDWNDVHGHNEYAAKACPSFDVTQDVAERADGFEGGNPEPGDPALGAVGLVLKNLLRRVDDLEKHNAAWGGDG